MRARFFTCLIGCALGSNLAQSADTLEFQAEHPYTVDVKPDGSFTHTDKAQLFLNVFKTPQNVYRLEVEVDVAEANQAILPVDASGKLTAEAKALNTRPFVKFRLPGGFEKLVDVRCNRTTCKSTLDPFPYDPHAANQSVNIEVNIRGMRGKNWDVNLQRIFPIGTDTKILQLPMPMPARQPSAGLSVVRYSQKNSFYPADSAVPEEPEFIDEWLINGDGSVPNAKSSVGPWSITERSQVDLLDGEAEFHYSVSHKTLIKESFRGPLRFWFTPGLFLYFENKLSTNLRLRWIEFARPVKAAIKKSK